MPEKVNKWLYAFKLMKAPLFLLQLLHATDTSRANNQVVYPLLTANLEQLDEHLLQVLQHQLVRTLPNTLATIAPIPEQGEAMAAMFLNLGNLIVDFPQGNRAINLEIAIQCQQIALTFFNRQSFAEYWANCQNDLGKSYLFRIWGEKGENLEEAIRCFQAALEVHTRETNIETWAKIQVNLGGAYLYRIRGSKRENLEIAIRCLSDSLQVINSNDFHSEWIQAKTNLSMAHIFRIAEEKTENAEIAIRCLLDIAEVVNRDRESEQWAENQRLLGFTYVNRIQGNESENWTTSINYSASALNVFTRDAFPEKWAKSKINQGVAHLRINRIHPKNEENVEQAIRCFEDALQVYTREAFPQEYVITQYNLGIICQEDRQFQNAYTAFATAIDTIESIRGEIVLGSRIEEYKLKLAEEWNNLYQRMVEVCVELGNPTKAIEYVERSKTRNLVELILSRDFESIFSPDIVSQLEKLQNEIADGQYQLQASRANNPKVIVQHLQELRSQRQELQDKYLPVGSGFKFDQFQSTLDNHTAVIEWYITENKILAFIIKPKPQTPVPSNEEREVIVWQSEPEDLTALIDWINEYLQGYYQQKEEWQNQLESRLKKLADILHIEDILNQIPKHCDKLILIPHRYLHLFPLHALPIQESCLIELFPNGVSYAPSCQLLELAQQRQREDFESIFAIQNPTEDLLFTDLEVNSILPLFSSHQVLPKTQATKTALSQAALQLQQANYLHFSCHGLFNPNSPLDSYLLLAGAYEGEAIDLSKCLTLGNLFDRNFEMNQCRLVTLSACETGLIDFKNTSDEYIGLPSGFLYAGSKSVVSSLWAVKDVSTALLMIRFYQNLKAGLTVAVALNQAQVWLRDSTQADIWKWTQQLNLAEDFQEQIRKHLSWFDVDEIPFGQPVYWAAFCAVGR